MMVFGSGFDFIFAVFLIAFVCIFVYIVWGNLKTWNENNNSPIITAPAVVVDRRSRLVHHGNGGHTRRFYVTFAIEDEGGEKKDEIEFSVRRSVYYSLNTGDKVRITYQGTRFHGVE